MAFPKLPPKKDNQKPTMPTEMPKHVDKEDLAIMAFKKRTGLQGEK